MNDKEKVLEIEYMPVFDDKFIVRIKKQNTDILKRMEFIDDEIGVRSYKFPQFTNGRYLYLRGQIVQDDDLFEVVSKSQLEEIIHKVALINEKYGIKIRKRVPQGKRYCYIDSIGDIRYPADTGSSIDDTMFEIGNYFETEQEAKQSEIYKGFQKQKEALKR